MNQEIIKKMLKKDCDSKSVLFIDDYRKNFLNKKKLSLESVSLTNVLSRDKTNDLHNKKNYRNQGDRVIYSIKGVEFSLIYCDKGIFVMGDEDFLYSKYSPFLTKPTIESIEQPFLLGETIVTQELYSVVMGCNPSHFKSEMLYPNAPKHPIEMVSWYDAIDFCNKLSALQGFEPYYKMIDMVKKIGSNDTYSIQEAKLEIVNNANGYRLPLTKEWEYAAKANTKNIFSGVSNVNDVWIQDYIWCRENSETKTQIVGSKKPNDWGFHDMNGNVWEWSFDIHKGHSYKSGGSFRVSLEFDYLLRCTSHIHTHKTTCERELGFRIARSDVC